jgi:hypothetical protein
MFVLGVAAMIGVVATGAVANTAQAAVDYWRFTEASGRYLDKAGSVEFVPAGEHFIIHDNATDGAGQRVEWRIMGVQQQAIEWHGGSGSHDFNRSVDEGDEIEFRICLMDDGVIKYGTCSLYLIAYA